MAKQLHPGKDADGGENSRRKTDRKMGGMSQSHIAPVSQNAGTDEQGPSQAIPNRFAELVDQYASKAAVSEQVDTIGVQGQAGDKTPPLPSTDGLRVNGTGNKPRVISCPWSSNKEKKREQPYDQYGWRDLRVRLGHLFNQWPIAIFLLIQGQLLQSISSPFFINPEGPVLHIKAIAYVHGLQNQGQRFQGREVAMGNNALARRTVQPIRRHEVGEKKGCENMDFLDNSLKALTLDEIGFNKTVVEMQGRATVPDLFNRQCNYGNLKMLALLKRCIPFFAILLALTVIDAGMAPDYAEARSKSGGRMFSSPSSRPSQQMAPNQQFNQRQSQPGGFGRGLMGGLLGGAIGGMLFGSLFGASGSGMGILPLLLLGVVGYFLYKRFANRPSSPGTSGYQPPPSSMFQGSGNPFGGGTIPPVPPVPPVPRPMTVGEGISEIRGNDPGFDENYFLEVASDVFFKIQAGWMHRELDSYRHLIGTQLASEYERHFAEMKMQGRINKLESIAIRKVEIVAAGSENGEDFVTVLFTANLLDYTVDDKTGSLVEGSMTEPVKFAEKWTWARPIRTENWKLEGIEVVEG